MSDKQVVQTDHILCNRLLYVHGKRFFIPISVGTIKAGITLTAIPDPLYDRTTGKKETWNFVDTGLALPTEWENVTKKVWAYPKERLILFQGEYLVEYLDPNKNILVEATVIDPDLEEWKENG